MAYDKVVDSAVLEAGLKKVGDSIRAKAGTSGLLEFPDAMSAAVDAIDTSKPEQTKTATPSTSQQVIKPDSGYTLSQVTVNAMPTATQATPSITVDAAGKITASATQTAGYVAAGTKSATKQLTVQAAKTVTPSLSQQTAVESSRYTTGAVTVAAITGSLLTSLDSDFKAENIAEGVNMFGVVGTFAGGSQVAYGTIVGDNTSTLSISGLSFAPKRVMVTIITTQRWARQVISAHVIKNGNAFHAYTGASGYEANYAACSASFTNTGVTITASDSSVIWNKLSSQYAWIAFDE